MLVFTMIIELNDILVLKKYLIGTKKNENGGDNLYNELYEKPKANAAGEVILDDNKSNVKELPQRQPGEPRVEELPDVVKKSTSTTDID